MVETASEEPWPPEPCMACRGTGRVSSNIGGTAHAVSCPWCDGAGTYLQGHDAQAHWRAEDRSTSV